MTEAESSGRSVHLRMKKREHPLARVPRLRVLRSMGEFIYDLDTHIDALLHKYQDLLNAMDGKAALGAIHEAVEEYQLISQSYHRQLRYAFITLLVSTIEDGLRTMASQYTQRNQVTAHLKAGSRLSDVRRLLAKELMVLESSAPEWIPFENLVKVRDCIVHCAGNMTKSRDRNALLQFSRHEDDIRIDEEGFLFPTRGFCHRALVWMDDLLIALQTKSQISVFREDTAPINEVHDSLAPRRGSAS